MKNAIIVHGKPNKETYYSDEFPSSSNFAWIPWLQKQLIIRDIKADAPEMPYAYEPDYPVWKTEFERFDITPDTILIGHSAGAGFLVRWLSEHKDAQVDTVVLAAPGLDIHKKSKTGFGDFTIDPTLAGRSKRLVVMVSDNDSPDILESVEILKENIPGLDVHKYPGLGHFIPPHMNGRTDFPELVAELLS